MKSSINAQINGERNHGWGQADSVAVIGDIVAEFAPYFTKGTPEHDEQSATEVRNAVMAGINQLVNPSATRQWLESKNVNLLDKQDSKATKSNKLFATF